MAQLLLFNNSTEPNLEGALSGEQNLRDLLETQVRWNLVDGLRPVVVVATLSRDPRVLGVVDETLDLEIVVLKLRLLTLTSIWTRALDAVEFEHLSVLVNDGVRVVGSLVKAGTVYSHLLQATRVVLKLVL